MRDGASPATDAAAALLTRLVALGVRDIVLSPGSRSQALALVVAALEERGLLRLHVRIDERVAGFTALGIGRESRVPAVLVCTSGSAGAHYLPAVLEAHHAAVPLLVLTADRPPELRGVGANQTTTQPGWYGSAVRFETDAAVPAETDAVGDGAETRAMRTLADAAFAAAMGEGGGIPGPVHLNLPYREPLSGELPGWLESATAGIDSPRVGEPAPSVLERGPRTIVIAGADAGTTAEEIAHAGSWPLVAEVVSGARFGRNLVHGSRTLLRDAALGGRIERVVVLGHPTLTREVTALLSREDVEIIAVRGGGEPLNLNGVTTTVDTVAVGDGTADRDWLGAWLRASRDAAIDLTPPAPDAEGLAATTPRARLDAIAAELGVIRAPVDRESLVDAVWRATWPHDRLVFGSSRLVRVADDVLGGKKIPVHSNRGLAGIDGTVATGLGVAIASQAEGAPGATRILLGDLALLHDAGALLLPPGETRPRAQVIVGNDGGGTIFDALEVAASADPTAFDRVLYTPQTADLEQLARAYGWDYVRATSRAELDQALTAPIQGPQLIEVPLPR